MLKQTARFAVLALLMAASATPLTAKMTSTQFDGPEPYTLALNSQIANVGQQDSPWPPPPQPPTVTQVI
jgi:hypothetical protein